MDRQCPLFAAQALDLKERHNKALHLTPVNVAKMHDDHRLFRVERALLCRGAQVSSSVRPLSRPHVAAVVIGGLQYSSSHDPS